MPPVNHTAVASVGIVAASVAVAAAIAIYEIPEVRRAAEDLRRRIAVALHSLGDNFDPNRQEPRFNRPEDADGFYQTHDVDADEETRRRQREELMYWNMRRQEQHRDHSEGPAPQQRPRGSTFDDFLQPDRASESGTFVYNSGANAWDAEPSNVLRRRGNAEGARGLNAAILANPFSDEHAIELEDRPQLLLPTRDVAMSDIYDATPRVLSPQEAPLQPLTAQPMPVPAAASEVLFDFASHVPSEYSTAASQKEDAQTQLQPEGAATPTATTARSATLERELAEDEYMTAGQDDRTAADAYASIQAWAQNSSNTGFYSPLPNTPQAPLSEPEMVSEGQLTPTDSASVAGSGVDVANEVLSATGEHADFDVMSETDGGIPTPGSWSEIGSVISESESAARA